MGYRATLEANPPTIGDLNRAASLRLTESLELFARDHYHFAIYIGGLAAEMFLKTACYTVDGGLLHHFADAYFATYKPSKYKPPYKADFESGHGLWFWSQELQHKRSTRGLSPLPADYVPRVSALYDDWYVTMRYQSGSATCAGAAAFLQHVEWIADNHAALRS